MLRPFNWRQNSSDILFTFLLFVLALGYYFFTSGQEHQLRMPNAYQARDIRRALALYFQHEWIWHGPELSGGGHLPGPFYYLLIGLPLRIFGTLHSLYIFEYALASGTAALMWLTLKRNFSVASGTTFYLIFLLSPFFTMNFWDFMNPSFLLFPLSIAFCCFAFGTTLRWYYAGAFLLGLCMQIHFIAVIFLFGAIVSFRKKPKALLGCTLFFLLPLLPYFYFRVFLLESTSTYYDWSSAVQKTLFVLKANFYDRPAELLAPEAIGRVLKYLLLEIYFFPALVFFWLFKKNFTERSFPFHVLWLGLLPLLLTLDRVGIYRYLIPLFFSTAFIFSVFLPKLLPKRAHLLLAAALFVAYHLMNSGPVGVAPLPLNLAEGRSIVEKVVAISGWNYDYFKHHTYADELNMWDDFSVVYRSHFEAVGGPARQFNYDGLLMTQNSREALPKNITAALKTGVIKCVVEEMAGRFNLCFYVFQKPRQARRWHNVGFAYDPYEKPKTGNFTFQRNECRTPDPSCSIYFTISLLPDGILKLQIDGDPLTVVDPFNNPTMTAYLKRPQLLIECPATSKTFVIANGIGFLRTGFLAPFDEFFELPCPQPRSITLKMTEGLSTFQSASFAYPKFNNFVPYEFTLAGPSGK